MQRAWNSLWVSGVKGVGFRVWALGCSVWGLRVLGVQASGLKFRVQDLGFGLRIWGYRRMVKQCSLGSQVAREN